MTGLPPELVEKAIWDAPWPWPLSAIEDWAKSVVNTILSWIRSVGDSLLRAIQLSVSQVIGWLGNLRDRLEDIGGVLGRALDKIWEVVKDIGAKIMDAVGSLVVGILQGIVDFLEGIAGRFLSLLRGLADKIMGFFGWVADRLRDILSSTWSVLVSLRPASVEEVPQKLPQLISTMGLLGVGIFLALDAASTQVLACQLDFSGLRAYLREIFSPGLVQGVLVGAILSEGWKPYIGRWVASTFRTWIPSPTEAYVLWRQGYISETELRSILAQHGTPEKWMAARMDLCDYTPSMRELLTVAQYTDLDLDWLVGKLRENGVAPGDEAKYRDLFEQTSLRRVHAEVWSAIYTAISYGVPARAHVEAYLREAKLRAYLIPYYLLAYDIRLNVARVRWWIEAYEEQVYRGLIEPEVAVEKMLALGVDKSYALARVAYQMARRGVLWEPPTL